MTSVADLAKDTAKMFDVAAEIHPEDHLYSFLRGALDSDEAAVKAYFADGSKSAGMFADLIKDYAGSSKVLEFASGYGRVTRHMKHAAPNVEIVACDIHPAANSFVSEQMGVRSIPSTFVPEEFETGEIFDMAFALSLFSHLPGFLWSRWLRALLKTVRQGGVVAFTTHGRVTAKNQNLDIPRGSILFREISEQSDLELATYGTSYVTPKYAFEQINSFGNARIVDFAEAYWWAHQDLYVIQKL
jgi:SAM-dependent methyltransferase